MWIFQFVLNYRLSASPSANLMVILGRAGVPMEVMGLMLGEFVDDYTVRVIDVFAMPQSGTVSHSFMFITTRYMC